MLNRPAAAHAELQNLSDGLEAKAIRRKWNPALHPRDSKGRFIETGGVVRLWGGKLARVVRALPNDRILVQDKSGPGEYKGRRHTTSAKWVSMVARPDGSAPTEDEDKVVAEDEKRLKDPRRGNGVAKDDDGDPDTPGDAHDNDDQGRPIGDDDGDGPDNDDDQDEPADGKHPINADALPNKRHAAGSRFKDTAAVRRHFTELAERSGQKRKMAQFLRSVAGDDDLRTTRDGRLAILPDDSTGRWYLTAVGTGQRMDAAGDFASPQEAARFAEHLGRTASSSDATAAGGFDFSDPELDSVASVWLSAKGENIQAAISRARSEFTNSQPAAKKTTAPKKNAAAAMAPAQPRFKTLTDVRTHWTSRNGAAPPEDQERLDALVADKRLKLAGNGQFVIARTPDGQQYQLITTGTGAPVGPPFPRQRNAQDLADRIVAAGIVDRNGKPLDLSDPDATVTGWRSKDNQSFAEVVDRVLGRSGNEPAPDADPKPTPEAATPQDRSGPTVSRDALKPGDRVKVTVNGRDIEWPVSTRDQVKPTTVTVEGTVATTYQPGSGTTGAPLVDVTLTGPDGKVMVSDDTARVLRMPSQVEVSGSAGGFAPEEMRADRVRVGDVVARGEFGHVVTRVDRYKKGRTFTTRNLGGLGEIDQFGTRRSDMLDVVPKARRQPEDVQRDIPNRTQQHASSTDARRAAAGILSDWERVNALAGQQWPDGAPEQIQALAQHMQNVTDAPKGTEGYQANAQAMRDALTAVDDLETDGIDSDLLKALYQLEENLDANAARFDADARAITENKRKREAAAQEQQRVRELTSRPPVTNLDDEQLRAEYDELTSTNRSNHATAQAAFESRLEEVERERRKRDRQDLAERPAPNLLETEQLRAEQAELARALSSYEADDVAKVHRQRMAAVEAELSRRDGGEPAPDAPENAARKVNSGRDSADTGASGEPLRYAWDRPERFVTLTMPEALVDFLYVEETAAMEDPDTRKALTEAKRGRSGTLKVTGPIEVHRALLDWAWTLAGGEGMESDPAEVRAYGNYAKRIDEAAADLRRRPQTDGNTQDGGKPKAPNTSASGSGNAPSAGVPTTPKPGPGVADSGTVKLSPDEVSAQLDAVHPGGSKAPSSMDDGELRDEIVSLMEREMENGGELIGVDRTRLRVLEAEEARRAGRAPKREQPKPPAEEPGGLFDVGQPDAPSPMFADPDNPLDRPDDEFGTPDMFAAAEGRDTSKLRAPQTRAPMDFEVGDRFVDADGRTYTVAEKPIRTGRGRVRVVSEGGQEHYLNPDNELRVLYPDEAAPEVPAADAPEGDAPTADAPEGESPAADAPKSDDANTAHVDEPSAPQPEGDAGDAGPVGDREPADMSADELADEIDDLEDVTRALRESTDPLELAYRLRAERRLWALQREEADHWRREPEYDAEGNLVEPSRGSILLDRVGGYGLNQDEARGAVSSVAELPPAKPGGYSDDEWEKIEAKASTAETYPPTDEQQVIIEGAARRGLDMRVMALAGTGKSTTLKMLSHRMPTKEILYLAFNRSVADEAIEAQQRGEYGKNLTPTTANAYANSMVDRALLDRLKWPRLNDQQLADRMRWYTRVQTSGDSLSPRHAAYYANKLLSEWVKSEDNEFAARHLPEELRNREAVFEAVKPLAEQMWANINDPKANDRDRDLPLSFDHTVKMWARSGRVPDTDVLFWDEAQDVNPVMEGIVRNIRAAGVQVVAVGDSNQAIYGFRGATDALGRLPADATATLTQTFRFGDAVADAGNKFLRLVGTRMRLKGWDRKNSRIAEIHPGDETMLIARTNAGVVLGAVEGLQAGRKVAVSGGLNDLRKFLEAAEALRDGKRTTHQELARFNGMDWDTIREEVSADKDLKQLDSMFKLMERHSEQLDALLAAVRMPRPLVEDDGKRLWVKLAFGDRNFESTKEWLKRQGFGYDGISKRWGYPPPRKGDHAPEQERTQVLQKVERYIADRYTAPPSSTGGQIVDQAAPHDLLVATAHKAKGLESERVRIAGDFFTPKETPEGGIDWDTIPDDEELRLAYVAVTRATDVLDMGSLGWVVDATRGDDPMKEPDGVYTSAWKISDFQTGNSISFWSEDGENLIKGTVSAIDGVELRVRTENGRTTTITPSQVARREGQGEPRLPVASPEELDAALRNGRFVPPQPESTVRLSQDEVRGTLARIRPEPADAHDDGGNDEESTARMVADGLPELPPLPKLTGLSRQNKDDVRRIRGDYDKIRKSLDGVLAGDPPTRDAREDLRRVREQLDYVAGRLTRDLLPESDQAQSVRTSLYNLGQYLDQALAALPKRDPQPLGEGPHGGTLFYPWDIREGDLVSFDAENPADRERGLAPYYGTFQGRASAASGEQGRTLVTYQNLRWNNDRQRWENQGIQHTVTMPPRGLVERLTPEQWDAWRRSKQSRTDDTPTNPPEVPPAPIGEASPANMADVEIAAELEALEAWRQRHVMRGGEGPSLPQRDLFPATIRIGNRRGALLDENRKRIIDRDAKERREKEARERAELLERAEIGARNGDGLYPVAVDGTPDVGTVSRVVRSWKYTNAYGEQSPRTYKSRADAVAALVRNYDIRRQNSERLALQDQARSETPEGWVLGDRDDVAENDIIRVPITRQDADGRPYPVGWRQPVRVNSVSRNDNGTMVLPVSNPDGSRSDISPVFLSRPDDTFAWASDRTRPEPTPAWQHELGVRMGDISDDIATLRNHSAGIDDQDRMQRLQELIQRVEEGNSGDLQADLRRIRDEAAWIEEEFSNPDLPYESRTYKSWATAAHRKAQWALDHPDFQTDRPDSGSDADRANTDDRAARAQGLFSEGMNAVGGESLPEMQELRDRLDRAGTADDPDEEFRSIAARLNALAEQYELAGPQGEQAADRFRRAARGATGEDGGVATDGGGTDAIAASAAVPNTPRFPSVDEIRDRWRRGELDEPSHPSAVPEEQSRDRYADDPTLEMSEGGRLTILQAISNGGAGWRVMAPGSMEEVARAFDRDEALAYARVLEGIRDADGRPFPWDAPDAANRALSFRGPNGESLGESVAQQIIDRGDSEGLHRLWQEKAQQYHDRERHLDSYYDAWRAQQEAEGYTIPVDVRDAQVGDDITALNQGAFFRPATQRGRLARQLEASQANNTGSWPFTVGSDYSARTEDRVMETDLVRGETTRTPFDWFYVRNTPDRPLAFRRPRPGEEEQQDGERRQQRREAVAGPVEPGSGNDDQRNDSTDDQNEVRGNTPENGDDQQQNDDARGDDEEERRRRRDGDVDGGVADPNGEPDGGGAGPPDTSGNHTGGSSGNGDGPGNSDDAQDEPRRNEDEDDEERRRRRRQRRDRTGGSSGPDEPGLPRLNLPDFNLPDATGDDGDGESGARDRDGGRSRSRHRDVDSLRNAWKSGKDLNPDEDTPERRALLAQAADREGLVLSPESGLVTWPEPQDDGSTVWRFAQVRNGTNVPGITLTTNDPDEARALAGRFEEITDRNGDPFDWHQAWGPSSVAVWRDGEGRTLPQALRAVQDDYEQERSGAFTLPNDLTTLADHELEDAYRQGLGPADEIRVMEEMDRRDGYVDERIRAAVPDTPPADAEEAERRGRAMDEALGFGDTDVTRPAPATPGRLHREFSALDEERFQAAMQATGGRLFNAESEDSGVDPRDLFSGRKVTAARSRKLASRELNDWWQENGGRLTYSTYRQREQDRVLRDEFALIDDARYRAAIDATNGYFFKHEYKYGGTNFDERELFSGGSLSARDRWRQYASEELQEWFDANGGRFTFAQFKQQRRDGERRDQDEFKEEQRRAAEAGGAEDTALITAGDVAPAPPFNSADVESEEDAAFRFGGHDRMKQFADQAEVRPSGNGETESVWLDSRQIGSISNPYRSTPDREPVWDARPFFGLDHSRNSRSQSRDTAIANLVVRALRDGPANPTNPSEDVWDTVTAHLGGTTRELPELPESLRDDPEARARYGRLSGTVDAFRDQRSLSGNLRDDLTQGRDDFAWLRDALNDLGSLDEPKRNNQQRQELSDLDARAFWAGQILEGLGGSDSDLDRPRADDEPQGDSDVPSPAGPTPDEPVNSPENTARPSPEPEPEPDPNPIGGQPAHWARVEDLRPGDMVRMNGTTKNGRPVQRAGYVYTAPERVEITRRGRTEQSWRTWVTENPDGTGAAGNVYTTINATAARAEAPDDVVPGSPATGAQAALRSGDLPDQIPVDRSGHGLFPGSTVTGSNDREGTVTGATNTTVAVRWSDGSDESAISPTSLTLTNSQRPDGWTADGQRVTPRSIVSDTNGALLGPVDDVDGDNVTISTAEGTVTRNAGDLRITGEVRDDVPATAPVTGIDHPAAADLKEGDVVVLDLDDTLATVTITSPPSRDGDRVTLQYTDTTTGEMGEINVDARAVLSRAQGADGDAPDLGVDDAPEPDDELIVHPTPHVVDPVTGPTVDPELDLSDRNVIGDHADGPDDAPDAHQAAVRITADLPVTPEQASALAAQLRRASDPSTPEGRAALRAADQLDRAAGRTPPPGLDRPRPSNAAQISEGDLVAMADERRGDRVRVFRVIDAEDGPGGVRSFLLEDENQQWRRRVVHGAMPVWQLPEAEPDPVIPPDADDTDPVPDAPNVLAAPSIPSPPETPTVPVVRARPGNLRIGDVIDAPVSRTGYQFNGHRRLTIISAPQHNGWWMQLTGMDEGGNIHDFGLHSGRAVNVYDRNRPTPALPPIGTPRNPNQAPQSDIDRIVSDHARNLAARIIDEATAGTEPPGDIHALREQIAQRLTDEALRDTRRGTRRDGAAALDAAGITGRDRVAAQRSLRETRDRAHTDTVRAALRTINDLSPLPDESNEDLAARARDLLRLIPDQVAGRWSMRNSDADPDITRTVAGHADDAVNALLQQLHVAGMDPGDAAQIARIITQQLAGSRQATARRIAARVAAASPDAGRQPGLLARIVALLIRMAKRLAELVKAGARKIAEKYRSSRERLRRLRAFLGRMVRRVRQWPESRRLARLHRAVNLPDAHGDSLAARISHWAGLMPEPGRFGQSQRRVTFWRPTTWGRLAAGRLPDRSDRIQWTPDRAADGGPGLTTLRHMAALRAAGNDVDQDVTRRLSAALGDDFGDDPHATLQHADDYVASSERRLVNLQAARSSATIPDDEDLEVEMTAARAELADARREYSDLRTRYAAAVPDAVAAALADVRDMGPEGNNALVFGPDTNPDAERAVRGVQRLIPRAWLNTEARRLTAVDGDQGRYEPQGQRITVADLADGGMGTAGYALAQHFARHLGDLDAAQRAFWFSRTRTGRPGARRVRPSTLDRLLRRQQTQRETGDTLARSVQAMFSGDWYQDDDLRAFLLGLMATR
ncbi:UvrD-helicase domain-containing protein [Streptomyces sp. NPDC059455]|uniref:UvrD-helicase domain-containing protein n=1 Tax=Streptomyces sp. NPDC059455 TaxID=3346837 RepID=UPI0036D1AC0A